MTQQSSFRRITALTLALALCAASGPVLAQGVAGSPFTMHVVQPGPQIVVGTAATPMPIDLDPLGGPWSKSILDPNGNALGPGIVDMIEFIQNVGTEPWGDWHEILLPSPSGQPPAFWTNVVNLTVNGNPIGFTATGLGTQTLNLFNFSQPVLPGQIFGIHKQLQQFGSAGASGAYLRIHEYPTPFVPEPTSFALLVLAAGGVACSRRRAK